MYHIYKISSSSPVDYAAEELKKYLRMMMPEAGDITIEYKPDATDGFRLGLMQDMGLDVSDVEDVYLDDILYVDTDEKGGIIAGDNPRSVLLAVYEYLRRNGCRWLFPSVDGEYIPMKDIVPVKFRHVPSCRYRGWCNEGAEYQSDMIDAIEFTPKLGLNIFMLEFRNPTCYYKSYYNHPHNEKNRPPEPVSDETVLQWKRQCECEIAKRGLQFHDVGHGWQCDPFGIDSARQDWNLETAALLPEDKKKYLALCGGKREIFAGHPNYTNFCMGTEEYRKVVVDYAVDYAEKHGNVDYIHIALGDSFNHYCECELCEPYSATDWFLILMNEMDEAFTKKGIKTKLVFNMYKDTLWAPEKVTLKNTDRFLLLFCPITRNYTETLPEGIEPFVPEKYVKNKNVMPKTLNEYFGFLNEYKKKWSGSSIVYEYHFWRHQYNDVGGIDIAKILNDDIKLYSERRLNGVIQDGSQRSFFPTGLPFYVYSRTLFDKTLSYEELEEEYLSCAFGEDWREFRDYLAALGKAFSYEFLERLLSIDPEASPMFNPPHVESLKKVYDILEGGKELIKSHYNSAYRPRTVSVRILEKHAKYSKLLADALIPKAQGKDDEADALFDILKDEMGKEELAIERWYDHTLAMNSLGILFKTRTKVTEAVTDFWQA